jgi:hypothetical protein
MLTALVLTAAVAAPVPPPAPPVAGGPAPRLLELKPDAAGKVAVTVTRTELQKVTVTVIGANGLATTQEREVPVSKTVVAELADVKELKVTTADGKKVDVADAVKAVKGGAVVVVSADGKPVSPNFLKAFKDDVLVLVSPELVPPAAPARPLPAPLPAQPLPAVQIQVAPAPPGK